MFRLHDADQQFLLHIIRQAVTSHLTGVASELPEPIPETLREPHGVFVTIHKEGRLRGCIGQIAPSQPLYRTAVECAISAAVNDPRFAPVSASDLPALEFEVSVLSQLRPVEDAEEIEIGIHGLLVTQGRNRGLLLPQVAASQHWEREEFLAQTCIKAGLTPDAWRKGARVERFSAFVFDDSGHHQPVRTAS